MPDDGGASDAPADAFVAIDSGCGAGHHACSGSCVADDSVMTCGASCTPCPTATGGTTTCDGTSCGITCPSGQLACDGACIDVMANDMHCGSCTIACNTGGSCMAGTCQGGLFGACTSDADCASGTATTCVDATYGDTRGLPLGMCTSACTSDAQCGSSGRCALLGTERFCMPSCAHGADCREGYGCVPISVGASACMPVCDGDAECGGGAFCSPWTGFCQSAPASATDPGADDGAPCGEWPDGSSNCRGLCTPALTRNADGSRTPTGFTSGICHSWCDVGPEWAGVLTSFPASACPSGTVCVPTSVPITVGDLGDCLPGCAHDTDCRDGYFCSHAPRPGDAFTDGYCAPIDCADGVHACPANYFCETGYDTAHPTRGRCHPPHIEHVVLIVQENHTFDAYFGRWCTAAPGSKPTCTSGPSCCEAAPAMEPGGASPRALDDAENYGHDRNHAFSCEVCQVDGGAMDHYVSGNCPGSSSLVPPVAACSSDYTFAIADSPTMDTYWGYATNGALADRYFQPIIGSTSSNDMYLAVAHYEFRDNDIMPDSWGSNCVTDQLSSPAQGYRTLNSRTIGDVLLDRGVTFSVYADGYGDAVAAASGCTDPNHSNCPCTHTYASDCRESIAFRQACTFDGSDIPFQYYARFRDNPLYTRDYESRFVSDVAAGQLPDFAYVKFRTSRNEHPNWSYITDGERWVDQVVSTIEGSPIYRDNTLILLTWDEGGGYFDHVSPPASIETFPGTDPSTPSMAGQPVPYGTRVPMLAIGPFARRGTVSHVPMEHSSIVRFLEFLFAGPAEQGSLGVRDAMVNNIGSMLDEAAVGVTVP